MGGRGDFLNPNILVQRAEKSIEELIAATCVRNTNQLPPVVPRIQCWSALLPGWLKVNWDASIEKNKGWIGYGVLVREEKGLVVAAQCKAIMGSLDPTLAGAGAALLAIQPCKTLGFRLVHFVGDSLVVVDGINSSEGDWSRKGLMVEEIKFELRAFPQWRMTFVRRDGNQATHALSKVATKAIVNQQWIFKTPDYINDIIMMEHTALSS